MTFEKPSGRVSQMGQKQSKQDVDSDYPALEFKHPFSDREVRRLWKRFQQLDHTRSGDISIDDLLTIYEISLNPMVYRIFILFCDVSPFGDDTDDLVITFPNFIMLYSVFHPDTPVEAKKRLLFKVFDVNASGVIAAPDLFYVLKMMLGDNINDAQLGELVSLVMTEIVGSSTDSITYDQFTNMIDDREVSELFTFSF